MRLLKDNLILFCVLAGLGLAWAAPMVGRQLAASGLATAGIVLIFVCLGFGLDLKTRPSPGELGSGFLGLGGLPVARAPGRLADGSPFPLPPADRVGLILVCSVAPTFVSGAVMAAQAKGDFALAMLLAVGINAIAVFSIPLGLSLTLGASVSLDAWSLLGQLVRLVLLPVLAGQGLRLWRPGWVAPTRGLVKNLPLVCMAAIIFVSTAPRREEIMAIEAGRLLWLALAAALAHLALLWAGDAGSRRLLGHRTAIARSVALVSSQKSLPLSIAVWAMALAGEHPGALMAPLVFHTTQILLDGGVASWWARR